MNHCNHKGNKLARRTQNFIQNNSTTNSKANKLIPVNLLSMCIIVVIEPATGMKASLMQTYGKYCTPITSDPITSIDTHKSGNGNSNMNVTKTNTNKSNL